MPGLVLQIDHLGGADADKDGSEAAEPWGDGGDGRGDKPGPG